MFFSKTKKIVCGDRFSIQRKTLNVTLSYVMKNQAQPKRHNLTVFRFSLESTPSIMEQRVFKFNFHLLFHLKKNIEFSYPGKKKKYIPKLFRELIYLNCPQNSFRNTLIRISSKITTCAFYNTQVPTKSILNQISQTAKSVNLHTE